MARPALGIPDRDVLSDPSALQAGRLYTLLAQQHQAQRAGPHVDVRIGDPETGLHSWAVRKGLPAPGQRHLAVLQPRHVHDYRDFEGEIPAGQYGAGTVKKLEEGQVLVTAVTPDEVHLTRASARHPERFLLKKTDGKHWLLINTTPTEPFPYQKKKYVSVPAEKAEAVLDNLQPGSAVQAKIDGAAVLARLFRDKIEVLSYRTSKSGKPILHSERIFHGRPAVNLPPELEGTVLRGEVYGIGPDGRAIPPQQLGGLLNATVAESLTRQKKHGIKLRNLVFDVEQLGKTPITEATPYAERRRMLERVLAHLPAEHFHLPEEARTPEEARALWEKVRKGEHPLTQEGLVIHPTTGKPQKLKLFDEHDVILRAVFPGEGKYKGTHAGGFSYSHAPNGPIVGDVGGGLSDELRRDLWENPRDYVGRTARVKAQGKFPSEALRAPSLIALHEDVSVEPRSALAAAAALSGAPAPVGGSVRIGDAVRVLRKAKQESDRRNWPAKHSLVRQAVLADPEAFLIDSEANGIAGLTHRSGFRIHVPSEVVPDALRRP